MGTNNSCDYSPTQYNVQTGGANGTLNNVSPGTSGQVLTSNGASAQPSFQTSASGGVTGPGSSTNNGIATWNGTGGTALLSPPSPIVSSTGVMTNTNQPCFLAYLSLAGTGQPAGIVHFDTVVFDQASNFTTGRFVASVTGKYFIFVMITMNSYTSEQGIVVEIIANSRTFSFNAVQLASSVVSQASVSGTAIVDMTAGDAINIFYYCSTNPQTIVGSDTPIVTFITGYLLC